MRFKRWLLSGLLAGGLMVADLLAMIGVTRLFLPARAPHWATAVFFWALAWPVPLFARIFPNTAGGSDRGPSMVAVAMAALVDLLILTALVDRWRRRRAAAGAQRQT